MTVGDVHPWSAAATAPWTRAMAAAVMAAAPLPVEPAPRPDGTVREHLRGQDDSGDRDRHGDEEDRRPAEGAGEQSAGHDAGGSAQRRGGAPDAHGPGSLRTGEGQQQQGHRGRAEGGGAGALDERPADEQPGAVGARRQQGAER